MAVLNNCQNSCQRTTLFIYMAYVYEKYTNGADATETSIYIHIQFTYGLFYDTQSIREDSCMKINFFSSHVSSPLTENGIINKVVCVCVCVRY